MAVAVQNSIVVCCFMTPEYQESRNCRLELEYAHTLKKRIIPCMLSDKNGKKWTPSDWLGLITTGANFINMRDQSESNIQSKAEELINRIRNHPSVQPTVSGSQTDSSFDLIRHEYLQNSFIHRIINEEKCFPIEQSYINLAIVQSEEQKDKEKKLSKAEHKDAIISTFEEIYGTKTVIDVKDMFEKCKDGSKKVLVLGRAGIGKSTFCRYVTYQWAKGEIWTQYQLVILIKLRMLTNDDYPPGRDYSPFDLVKKEYASRITLQEEDRSSFEEQCKKGQVLWLLDGYDEFVQNIPKQLHDVFHFILNRYYHILTSRPYSITLSYDVKMEITGFTDDNIAKYIGQFFAQIKDQSEGHKLESFLKSNPNIWGIAHIPVNLELICSLWGDTDRSQTTTLTMTGLYDNITEWLLRRHLLKNKNLPQTDINGMFKTDIDQYCRKELMFLGTLAFNAMKSSTLILQPSSFEQALEDANQTVEDKKHIFNIGVLKSFDGKATGNQSQAKKEYYFVHLSFQEYFAARYLVNNLSSSAYEDSIVFIRHNKYNQRFTLVFVFASGLLAGKDSFVARNAFWDALFEEPVDLVGFRHMQILVSCLEEVSDKSDISHYPVIIENVSQWIKFTVSLFSSTLFKQLQDSLKRSSVLSREPILRDQLIHLFQRSDSRTKQRICVLISALSTYHVDPERLLLLTSAIWNEDDDVSNDACDALGEMGEKAATSEVISKLVSAALNYPNVDVRQRACAALGAMGEKAATSEVISKLVNALNDENEEVRRSACDVLGRMGEKAATSEVINKLASALNDEKEYVRYGACDALGEMGEKAATSDVISNLISAALNDEDEYVRYGACDALGEMGEKAATSEVINKLASALNDENESVRYGACYALATMGEKAATSEVISKLVSALNDEDEKVRTNACAALGAMGEKAATSEVISKLVNALNDEDEGVMTNACYALGRMGEKAATSEVISKLVSTALNDGNANVRYRACNALGAMGEKAATSEVISKLISALNDEKEYVRSSACYALGAMGEKAATSEVISKLVNALNDENEEVRRSACDVLGRMGEKAATSEVINKLASALNDGNANVRYRACDALDAMGENAATSEVISKLVSAALNDKDEDVRRCACHALGAMSEKAATSEVISKLVSALMTSDIFTRWYLQLLWSKMLVSCPILIELSPEAVEKLLTCIESNLWEDLTFMPADALIKAYIHTRWSCWSSIVVLVTLLQGVAVTIVNDSVIVFSSKEPVELQESNRQVLDELVEGYSKQADRFGLSCVRPKKSLAPVDHGETVVPSPRQGSVVNGKSKPRSFACVLL